MRMDAQARNPKDTRPCEVCIWSIKSKGICLQTSMCCSADDNGRKIYERCYISRRKFHECFTKALSPIDLLFGTIHERLAEFMSGSLSKQLSNVTVCPLYLKHFPAPQNKKEKLTTPVQNNISIPRYPSIHLVQKQSTSIITTKQHQGQCIIQLVRTMSAESA